MALGQVAGAQDKPAVHAAAEAYDAGVQAHRQKDYGRAATLFARADELAPDPAARLAALKSVLLADDPVLGMTLAERAARAGPMDAPLAEAVKAAREKFEPRVGRLRVACDACAATVDGSPVAIGQEILVTRGEHTVETSTDGRVERRSISVGADPVSISPAPATAVVAVVAPPLPPPAASESTAARPMPTMATGPRTADRASGGLSPAWFFVGAGITVLAGGLTIASGIDVRNRESEFYRAPTEQKAVDGQSAETRTYVLGGITGAAALATAALGIFAVSWTDGPLVRIGAAERSAGVSVRSRF
jgi:hypothetical protein